MGRKLEFDPDSAAQDAMHAFWRKGFERTSIADLETATGVGRKSLYRAFEDKEELFLRALGHYRSFMSAENLAPLLADDANLDAIRGLFLKLASFGGTEIGALGCLICNTAVECAGEMPAADRHVAGYFDQIRAAMAHALSGAVAVGQISLDPRGIEREANFLLGAVQGLSVLGRAGASRETMQDIADTTLKRLG